MTDELTLRRKIVEMIWDKSPGGTPAKAITDAIAAILEDTGSPAHMRVAAELRGLHDA